MVYDLYTFKSIYIETSPLSIITLIETKLRYKMKHENRPRDLVFYTHPNVLIRLICLGFKIFQIILIIHVIIFIPLYNEVNGN
jgi:hypothetical protein